MSRDSKLNKLFNRIKWNSDESNKDINKSIVMKKYVFYFLFGILIVYILVFTVFKSDDVINNSYNKRESLYESEVVRGNIYLNDLSVAATSVEDEDGNYIRKYPYARLFSHIVGYRGNGNLGIERNYCYKMLTSHDNSLKKIANDFKGDKDQGDSLVTTLDLNIQKVAYDALGDRVGAIYVMNVKTGDILAVVSKPDFDPNSVNENWDSLNERSDSPLLNRATSGLYPPGSTFKIITALEYIREHSDYNTYSFDCTGSFTYEDETINCYHGQSHGHLDFADSFAESCNSSFANITTQLNKKKFKSTIESLMFKSKLPIPVSYKESEYKLDGDSGIGDLMQTGIGQGGTLVSPSHMTLITAAIANEGVLMQPRIVSRIVDADGEEVESFEEKEYAKLLNENEASVLKDMMREVVISGTGKKLNEAEGYEACGKTGSAEFSKDKSRSHSWFTGFAPLNNPEIALSVLVEDGGSGSQTAVPIAKSIFDQYFR